MFDKVERIVNIVKNITITLFFICLINLTFSIDSTLKNVESDVLVSTSLIRRELVSFRQGTFDTLNSSISRLDYRLSSFEKNVFTRVDEIDKKTFVELEKTNKDIHDVAVSITQLSDEYQKIPKQVSYLTKTFEPNINCQINEYCWPNLFSDLLIDSRNMVRDGSKTFTLVNNEIPKITGDVTKVSNALSIGIPKVTENTTKITENVQRLTKPKWYDRLLGIGANGTLIYYNIYRR